MLPLLCCVVALLGRAPGGAADLLGAPPMAGRPGPAEITVTLIGGALPVAVQVDLAPEAADGALAYRPVRFDAATERPLLGGRQVRGTLAAAAGPAAAVGAAGDEYREFVIGGLEPGTAYRWRVRAVEADGGSRTGAALRSQEWAGRIVTMRPPGASFTFDLISDMHFFIDALEPPVPDAALENAGYLAYVLDGVHWFRDAGARVESEFARVAANVVADRPDFVIGLGDHFDLHSLDFNAALLTPAIAEAAHRETRRHLAAELAGAGALFQVLGNWEAESGDHALEHRAFGRAARRRHALNPRNDPPTWRAAPGEDYFAFQWGDLLVVGLNVRGYTPTSHLLDGEGDNVGHADDFTLGAAQKAFLERELQTSTAAYRILCLHHVVGGNGGDQRNSDYGRGGGRAAHVGEQAWVHELMRRHGVQVLFYGHDHVFADMEVDGIHYSLPGTTGAPWRFTTAETGYERFWPDAGHGRVTVTPAAMTVEFVDFRGQVLHSYSVAPRVP